MSTPPSRLPSGWTLPVAMLLIALVAAIPIAAVSGATTPLVIGDAGAIVRWGMPILGVVHDLAAALTVGLLMVAAFLVREGPASDRRGTAARAAAVTALIWLVSALAQLILSFGELAGVLPSTPGYLNELRNNLWELEGLRLFVIELGMVLILANSAFVARTRATLAWTAALALACLGPTIFRGHSGSAEGHETAVTALTLHLAGVSIWVGGLLAIAMLLPALGRALPDVVRRYSTLAAWSFVAVALSGVLFTSVTIYELSEFDSPYGVLLIVKLGLLILLGIAGLLQRRHNIRRGVDSPARFARFALGELVIMALAIAAGVVLSRTPPPVWHEAAGDIATSLTGFPLPRNPWGWDQALTVWRIDWMFSLIAVIAVGLYLSAVIRLRRRGDSWPVIRPVLWVLGWSVFVYITSGAPAIYGRVMFSVHMIQHMALMLAVPILLVPANPVSLALRALTARKDRTLGPREIVLAIVHSRWAGLVANPVVAGVIFFGSLVAFYWSGILGWVLTSHSGHLAMVLHFTLAGYLFVYALVGTDPGPAKWPAPLRIIVLLATLAGHAFFGLAIMQGTWLLAPEFYKAIAVPWVPDLLADQQLGGTIAWGIGELPTVILMLMVGVDWARRDAREAARTDRQADRDDDAELAAYNARLQALAGREEKLP